MVLIAVLGLAACDKPRSEAYAPEQQSAFRPVTAELEPAKRAQTIEGTATLISPDALTQIDAEIRTAEIAAGFSRRTVERFKGTTTLGEYRLDNAERQAQADATRLTLLGLKLRNAWGDAAPFLAPDRRKQLVDELSSGNIALVRLDFPRSITRDLKNIRITPLGGGSQATPSVVWAAPSGTLAMPGTSFFGILPTSPGLRPGDRANVVAERGDSASGVVVPTSAVVVFEGDSWCYVESNPGGFERKRVSLSRPVADGYLSSEFPVGTKVVIRGASALLSREAGPGSVDDDDDAGGDADREYHQPQRPGGPNLAKANHPANSESD